MTEHRCPTCASHVVVLGFSAILRPFASSSSGMHREELVVEFETALNVVETARPGECLGWKNFIFLVILFF